MKTWGIGGWREKNRMNICLGNMKNTSRFDFKMLIFKKYFNLINIIFYHT